MISLEYAFFSTVALMFATGFAHEIGHWIWIKHYKLCYKFFLEKFSLGFRMKHPPSYEQGKMIVFTALIFGTVVQAIGLLYTFFQPIENDLHPFCIISSILIYSISLNFFLSYPDLETLIYLKYNNKERRKKK